MCICRVLRRWIVAIHRTVDVALLDDEPYWFTHYDLEKEGLIVESIVPSEKRPNLLFKFACPRRDVYIISIYYEGCEKAILESQMTRANFLAMLENNQHVLNLDYVQFNLPRMFGFFDKLFPEL